MLSSVAYLWATSYSNPKSCHQTPWFVHNIKVIQFIEIKHKINYNILTFKRLKSDHLYVLYLEKLL